MVKLEPTQKDRQSAGEAPLPLSVEFSHVLHPHAEDEQVFLAGLLGHLHIGSIHGADGQGSVQHELHVARS